MTAVEEDAEWWVRNVQATLGQFVLKPKLTAERLRKPPFRFLFDVVAEVARQTGFGVQELFEGETPPAKPAAPSSREDKTIFLDRWIETVASALGENAVAIAGAQGSKIVCGLEPEVTSLLLHATAAACHPDVIPAPAPIPAAPPEEIPVHEEQAAAELAPAPAEEAPEEVQAQVEPQPAELAAVEDLVGAVEAPPPEYAQVVESGPVEDDVGLVEAPAAEEQVPLVVPEAQQVQSEDVVHSLPVEQPPQQPVPAEEEVAPFSGAMMAPEGINEEQAKEIAANMNFDTALKEFESLDAEFRRTCDFKNLTGAPAPATSGGYAGASLDEADMAPAAELRPEPSSPPRPVTGSTERKPGPAVVARLDEGVNKANKMLEDMEAMLDERDQIRETTTAARQAKAEQEARARQEQEELERAEQERAEEEARLAAEDEERWAQEQQERMQQADDDIPEAPEKPKKEKKKKVVYPKSKASMAQGARIVSCIGDEGTEAMYESDEEDEKVADLPTGLGSSAGFGGMSGMSQTAPAGGFGLSHPLSSAGLNSIEEEKDEGLLNRIKLQCGDSWIAFLLNSLPQSLLKQAEPDELTECLQLLLQELRKCLTAQGLEDADEEEPSTLAAELREQFPNDWLPHLQSCLPKVLLQKYDTVELLDTLQALAQICFERLQDERGQISQWCAEDSPLRTAPKAPPARAPSPEKHSWDRPDSAMASSPTVPADGPWDGSLGKAYWEEEVVEEKPKPTPKATSTITKWDATLGKAAWETDDVVEMPAPKPATAFNGKPIGTSTFTSGFHSTQPGFHSTQPGFHTQQQPGFRAPQTAAGFQTQQQPGFRAPKTAAGSMFR